MNRKSFGYLAVAFLVLTLGLLPPKEASAQDVITTPAELIDGVNGLRLAHGLAPLTVHPILMQTAQGQADYGAATGNLTHERPGGISYTQQLLMLGFPLGGDLTLGGYRSENILSAPYAISWNEIYASWSDDLHLNTMLKPVYTSIGAGIAQGADGEYYYVIDCAAMTASGKMQSSASVILTDIPGTPGSDNEQFGVSQYMIPVLRSTARPDGDVIHKVRYGQTLWSIAIAYGTTINNIRALNNLGEETTIYEGQLLLVQKGATQPPPPTNTPPLIPTFPPTASPTYAFPTIAFPTKTVEVATVEANAPLVKVSPFWIAVLIVAVLVGGFGAAWFIRPSGQE